MASKGASGEIVQLRAELEMARLRIEKAEARADQAEANARNNEAARVVEAAARVAEAAAARTANADAARVRAINADLVARNTHLELINAMMRRDKYGTSSERSERLFSQLELTFEDLEADASAAEIEGEQAAAGTPVKAFIRKRGKRREFPAHLPREEVIIPAPEQCPCCGSDELSHLPPDITETLETVPASHKVIKTVREKVSCRCCEKIRQQPAPFYVTPRGMFGPNFLANLTFQKYALHQPLNSQRDRLEHEGIPISLSTLADQVGAVEVAVRPLIQLIEAHVLAAERLHGDDTTVPRHARLKTDTARIWDYVRDDRPFGGPAPPAVVCYYSRNRRGEHPRRHLAGYTGTLQVDRYAGFDQMFADGWADKPMTRANCWAHSRRKFFELADAAHQLKKKKRKKDHKILISPLAVEAVRRIDELFMIEREINGKTPAERLSVRKERSAPLVHDLKAWMEKQLGTLSSKSDIAKAMRYLLNDWYGFTSFLEDGRICLTNNAAERQLRGVARGRKAWLFVGSDRGGDRAAAMFTLFGTARLNDVDPLAWFSDVLARIADIPQSRLHELLPWNWKAAQQAKANQPLDAKLAA